ncbi:MAG: hypothetical protein OEM52_08110 [bacterium]|nr:hypothetical protein [bacterium]
MFLKKLLQSSPNEIKQRKINQIISFAGDGHLKNDSRSSKEFRDFLTEIDNELLIEYGHQCCSESFIDNGFAFQDIVNQIGKRLGFKVKDGLYQGTQNEIGFDGLWRFPDGHNVIIETKISDSYQIPLDRIAEYRKKLIQRGECEDDKSSILLILGRSEKSTENLEAQIRGSKFAWITRLISYDSLCKLMKLKDQLDNPTTISKISHILIPREFTRIDSIIDLVFDASESAFNIEQENTTTPIENKSSSSKVEVIKYKNEHFREQCVELVSTKFNVVFTRQSQSFYINEHNNTRIIVIVSSLYQKPNANGFWFAFHKKYIDYLKEAKKGYLILGCYSDENILVIPAELILSLIDNLNYTINNYSQHWHLQLNERNGKIDLYLKNHDNLDLSKYRLQNIEL